jgi:hypothetical protein
LPSHSAMAPAGWMVKSGTKTAIYVCVKTIVYLVVFVFTGTVCVA